MKLLIMLLTAGLAIASSARVEAATSTTTTPVKKSKLAKKASQKKASKKTKKVSAKPSEARTNFNFADHGVTGEYQVPDEALARVENEKSLTDLLGVRRNFKDRLQEASEQE